MESVQIAHRLPLPEPAHNFPSTSSHGTSPVSLSCRIRARNCTSFMLSFRVGEAHDPALYNVSAQGVTWTHLALRRAALPPAIGKLSDLPYVTSYPRAWRRGDYAKGPGTVGGYIARRVDDVPHQACVRGVRGAGRRVRRGQCVLDAALRAVQDHVLRPGRGD